MHATAEVHNDHHEIPSGGSALTGTAVSATLHCLTGCAIGEVAGMAIGTALGFSNLATIALAVALAFIFGYSLTSLPLLRAGFALSAVVPIALASDTLSIATMEVIDNLIMVAIPGAMHAGLDTLLFWGSLSFALAVAFVLTVPVNGWLIARGKGHAAVHETGIHGGPDPWLVGGVMAVAAVFGISVLVAEATVNGGAGHGDHGDPVAASTSESSVHGGHGAGASPDGEVHGVSSAEDGLRLELGQTRLTRNAESRLTFEVIGEDGDRVTDFDVIHAKRMHLIVVRRDMTGFQHLHPEMSKGGAWSTPLLLSEAGVYRVFADFTHEGENETLGSDLYVDGPARYQDLPAESSSDTTDGYEVEMAGADSAAGEESPLAFIVTRGGEPVEVEPYLGADGHLVALREGDLAFLHVHPTEHGAGEEHSTEAGSGHGADGEDHPGEIRFETTFPTEGRYRLFLQFRHEGGVHTAEFTREAG